MEQSEIFYRELWYWWEAGPIMHVEPMLALQLHGPSDTG